MFIAFPLLALEVIAVTVLWTAVLLFLSIPVWTLLSGDPLGGLDVRLLVDGVPWLASLNPVEPWAIATASLLAGIVLLPVAAFTAQGLMALHRAVIAGLLCDSGTRALEQRVETLEESRKAVLDVEASELRRIERDLHDGAQQRLVMLTINLGLAADRIDEDPEAAKGLVIDAREQARLALAEIRDLVRGIAPSILMDRGLVAALSALAGRSPVPTVVLSSMPAGERLPDAAERAAYFVVAEAMANVAKHAQRDPLRDPRPARGAVARGRRLGRRPRRRAAAAGGRAHGARGAGRGARRGAVGHEPRTAGRRSSAPRSRRRSQPAR